MIYYLYPLWYVVPYAGLVFASLKLFSHAPKWAARLMFVGSAAKCCEMIVKWVVLNQGYGLWPLKSSYHSPEEFKVLQLQQDIWTFFDRAGSLGMLLFAIGLLLFARKLCAKTFVQANASRKPAVAAPQSTVTITSAPTEP
jgi:hypothetical protein